MISTRTRWAGAALILLVAGGASAGYGYYRHERESSRTRAASCLRPIAQAALMYTSPQALGAGGGAPDAVAADRERIWGLLEKGGQVVVFRQTEVFERFGLPAAIDG